MRKVRQLRQELEQGTLGLPGCRCHGGVVAVDVDGVAAAAAAH